MASRLGEKFARLQARQDRRGHPPAIVPACIWNIHNPDTAQSQASAAQQGSASDENKKSRRWNKKTPSNNPRGTRHKKGGRKRKVPNVDSSRTQSQSPINYLSINMPATSKAIIAGKKKKISQTPIMVSDRNKAKLR